jgi:hypothetical protein
MVSMHCRVCCEAQCDTMWCCALQPRQIWMSRSALQQAIWVDRLTVIARCFHQTVNSLNGAIQEFRSWRSHSMMRRMIFWSYNKQTVCSTNTQSGQQCFAAHTMLCSSVTVNVLQHRMLCSSVTVSALQHTQALQQCDTDWFAAHTHSALQHTQCLLLMPNNARTETFRNPLLSGTYADRHVVIAPEGSKALRIHVCH